MIFSKRKTIGVFTSKMFKPFDDAFFLALDKESRRLDYDIVVFTTAGYYLTSSDYDIQEKNILHFAPIDQMDGIIAVPSTYEKGEFRDLVYETLRTRAKCPLVTIREENDEFSCVYTDNETAVRMLLRHLIEDHGLKKICFQTGDSENTEMDIRLNAYKSEMADHALTVTDDCICPGNMWTSCGDIAYDAFFSDPENIPDAVVCANDYMAMGLMRVLKEKGYKVPEDVIVTGFDNVMDWCTDVPSLTTIEPDFSGMVTHAMEYLDEQIRGKKKIRKPVRTGLPGKLILGESCGCGKRDENFFRDLTERSMAIVESSNDQDAEMNNMTIDLGACDDLSELHEVMISQRTKSPIVRDHYICLFGESDDLMNEAGNKACLVHAIRDHRDCGMPMISFNRKKLLPLMAEREDEAQLFFLKLLHQNGHNFGYSVIHYDPEKSPSRCFVQTSVLLSIALENIRRRDELMALYEERRLSSITDMLTGLLNRRGLVEQVEPVWHMLIGKKIAFICIDLDKLKVINDTFGHAAGDFAIRLVGRAIHDSLPSGAAGARIGGDEFVVFLPEAGNGIAEKFTGDFEACLEKLNKKEKRSFKVCASVGCAIRQLGDSDTIEKCIQESDRILYKVKEERHRSEAPK